MINRLFLTSFLGCVCFLSCTYTGMLSHVLHLLPLQFLLGAGSSGPESNSFHH